jgi:hypothetical protein
MSLGLSVATEVVLNAAGSSSKSTPHDTTDPMNLFLAHTMLFVGSIWKNKSGWFLFVMSLGLSVATEVVLTSVTRRIQVYFVNVDWRETDAGRKAYSAGDTGNQRTHHNLPPELHTPRHHVQCHNKLRLFSAIRHQMQLQTMFFVNY